jgi:hypothetical protein
MTTFEQHTIDVRLQLEERDQELTAALSANREPSPTSPRAT